MGRKKNILLIGASSSKNSINRVFARFAGNRLKNVDSHLLDLNDFEMPIYSIDREKEGIPEPTRIFRKLIEEADAMVISLAEHNGSYTAAFKNLLDWTSRLDRNLWQNKPMLLLSTSPGQRGARNVMSTAMTYFPRLGADIIGNFSLPGFRTNFNGNEIIDEVLRQDFDRAIEIFQMKLDGMT